MTLRVVQPTFTFELQRQEINLLASDVGDVDLTLTPSNTVVASINDIIVGNVTLSGQTIGFEDGHSTAPAFYFDSNQKLGFYRYDINTIGITNNLYVASGLTVGGDFLLEGTLDLGNDLNVRGDATISGTLYNLGAVTFDSTLSVTDDTLLKSDLDVQGNTTISGTLYNGGNATLASDLDVQGNTTISGTLYNGGNATLASDLDVQGNTTISGTVLVGGNTTFRSNLFLGDNDKINLGDSNDLQIYHDGSNSYITDTGTGDLILRGSADIRFENPAGNEIYATFNVDSSVELYFNNTKRFQTTNTGANVLGALDVDGDINIDGGDITVSTTTFNLANGVATTVNAFNSATLLTFGATTGTTNVRNNLDIDGDLNVDGGDITTNGTAFNLLNSNATTVNAFGASTALNLGATTGTTTVRNNLDIQGNTTISGTLYVEGDVTFKSGSSGSITIGDQNTDNVVFGADINSGLIPNTDDNYDLGSLDQQWKDLYIDGIASIDTLSVDENATITGDLAVNGGDITTTASAFNLLNSNATTVNAFGASTTLNIGATTGTTTVRNNLDILGNTTVSGTLLANGDITFNGGTITLGNANTDNVVFGADINSSLIPNTDDNYDLGSPDQQWKNLYIDGTATIDTLLVDENATITGDLGVNGGDITTNATTFNLLNSNATAVNAFGEAESITIGAVAVSGVTNIRHNLDVDGNINLDGGKLTTSSTNLDVFLENISQARLFTQTTNLFLGGSGSNTTIRGNQITLEGSIQHYGSQFITNSSDYNLLTSGMNTLNFGTSVNSLITIGNAVQGTTQIDNNLKLTKGTIDVTTADTTLFIGDNDASPFRISTVTSPYIFINSTTGSEKITLNKNTDIVGNLSVTGNINFAAGSTIAGNIDLGDSNTDTLTINAEIDSDVVPADSNTYDLGSPSNKWRSLYIESSVNVGTGNFDSISIAGDLAVNGGDITSTSPFLNIGRTVPEVNIGTLFSGITTIGNDLYVGGRLIISGTTTQIDTEILTVQEPIIDLGTSVTSGVPALDPYSRGIRFYYVVGSGVKEGFFGYNQSTGYFDYIPDATEISPYQFDGIPGILNVSGVTGYSEYLKTARTIELTGDVTGSAIFDGSQNIQISGTIVNNAVELGVDTFGQYAETVTITGLGLSITAAAAQDGTNYLIDSSATNLNIGSTLVFRDSNGDFSANIIAATLSGNAFTASRWEQAMQLTVDGDIDGTASFDGFTPTTLNLSIKDDSVLLGAKTVGQYAETVVVSGKGITATSANASDGTNYLIESSATELNVGNSLVFRDGDGDFSANIITADLSGTATQVSNPLVAGQGVVFDTGTTYDGSQQIVISTAQDVGTGSNVQFNDLIITGNLTVNGTTTTLNTETVTVDDPNITLGDIRNQLDQSIATDLTALGGGLTLKGDTDKIISWSGDTWNSTESFSVESGRTYQIDNQVVLSSDTLGSSVINSSLINVGDLIDLTVLGNTNLASSSGNVSIGGVPATAKLDVGGDVRIRGDLYDVTNDQGEPGDFLAPTASGIQWRSLDVANLLFVSKDGDDNNDGLSLFKAKATIKSALEVAESIILPQDSGTRSDAAILIDANKEFIQKETYGYITEKYPDLLNIGSLPSGANRYQDASNLILANKDEIADRALAEIAVQYNETLWGTDWIIPGDSDPGRGRYFDSYRLIQNNRSEIINTAWNNLIVAYPGSSTTETKCKRDIGYFVDYVSLDLFLGSNKYARKFILQYFCNGAPSEDGLVGEEAQSIYAFNQVRDLMKLAITNQLTYVDNTITDSNDDGNAAYTSGDCVDVQATIDTLTAIITTPISEGGTESLPEENAGSLQSGSSKCLRDIGYIIDAVASDLAVGGNIRSIEAAESYANGTSSPVDGEELQTVAAFTKAGDMMKLAINNQLIERDYTLVPDPLTGSNSDPNSCADVQNNIDTLISLINSVVTSGDIATISGVTRNDGVWFMRDITKCQRDIGYIVDAFVEDLRDGGNVNSVDAGNYYYDANGLDYINGQIDESIDAFEYVRDLSIAAMRNWDFYVPSAEIVNGSSIVTVPSTLGIVVGMEVTSASFGIPANTYVNEIISSTQFVLGNQDRTNTVNALATTSLTLDFEMVSGAWASGVTPSTTSGITLDASYPECANVTTAIVTYANIIKNILENGKDSVPKVWPGAGIKVEVKTGTYTEQNPLRVPTNVSVHGDDLRSVNVIPANPTEDIFHVYNGSYITGMTFQGHVAPSSAVAFPPTGAGLITKSPYIQNCTSITTTGCGMRVDGNRASGTKSMVLDSYTQYNQGGDGIVIINGGYAQLVSIFEICCDRAVYVGSGGTCSITNSNTDFGNFGLIADGTGPLQYTASIDGNGQTGGVFNLRNIGNNKPYVGQVCTIGGLYYTIQTINLTNGGSGYTSIPNVTIDLPTGPGAFPAQATATVENGKVTAVTLLVSGNQFEVCPRITIDAPTSGITATAEAEMYPTYYTINSSTKPVNGECTITLEENLPYTPNDGDEVRFYQVSRIIASAHCFEYVGSGTNINTALPAKGGVPIQDQEAVTLNGGRIAITSTDHLGNFRIGSDLVINQNTGTLSGRTFSRSLFAELTPFILALQ